MSAFEWPSVDMGPFFERVKDSQFLANDFAVDSMNQPNPRWIFGYQVLGLMNVFALNWHQALLLVKSFIVVLLPGFMFLFFVEATKNFLNKEKLNGLTLIFGILCIVLILFSNSMQLRISIGKYYQYELKATAHSLATLFGLVGSVLLFRKRSLSFPFLLASSLTHPAVGFIFCCINIIFQTRYWKSFRLVLFVVGTVLLPFIILLLSFSSKSPISTAQLIEIYIENRLPHHYDVNSWNISGLLRHMAYIVVYFGLMMFAFWGDRKKVVRSLTLAMVAYVGAVFSQYFFVHVVPLRPVVLLGPVRFTAFSFMICAPYLLTLVEDRVGIQGSGLPGMSWKPRTVGGLALLLCALVFLLSETNPLPRLREKSPELYSWVARKTEPSDVFVGPLDVLADEFVLLARRPVFISQIFPFSEELYPEYHRRWQLVYGPVKAERHQFFENKSVADWAELLQNEKIDYVILPADTKSPLKDLEVAFDSLQWVVVGRDQIIAQQIEESASVESAEKKSSN